MFFPNDPPASFDGDAFTQQLFYMTVILKI